jgi:uncharacterized membrane protein (DUF485 family)
MKQTFVIIYVLLVLAFSMPWYIRTLSPDLAGGFTAIQALLLLPAIPLHTILLLVNSLFGASVPYVLEQVIAPLYFAALFWPLAIMGFKPALLGRRNVKASIRSYGILFAVVMLISALIMTQLSIVGGAGVNNKMQHIASQRGKC